MFKKKADKTNNNKERPIKQVKKERKQPCGCGADVSRNWCWAIVKRRVFNKVTNIRLLAIMQSFTRVCYFYLKAIKGHIGLMLKHLNVIKLSI
jgi:hypothetical protein